MYSKFVMDKCINTKSDEYQYMFCELIVNKNKIICCESID